MLNSISDCIFDVDRKLDTVVFFARYSVKRSTPEKLEEIKQALKKFSERLPNSETVAKVNSTTAPEGAKKSLFKSKSEYAAQDRGE